MTKYSKDNEPPDYIDGAKVIKWSWSGQDPFGYIEHKDSASRDEIHGLAICQYEDSRSTYRFSCDKDWEVQQDSPYDSIEDAIERLPDQYKKVKATWRTK